MGSTPVVKPPRPAAVRHAPARVAPEHPAESAPDAASGCPNAGTDAALRLPSGE